MADSIRMQQLKRLSGQMPIANQQVANGLQAAQQSQFQSAIAGAKPAAGAMSAQKVGAEQATALAQPILQAQQQNQQQVGQIASQVQNQASIESSQAIQNKQSGLNQQSINNTTTLANMNNGIKNQLLDDQLTFAKDERGRTMLNDRQLADVAILKAKSDEDLANYKQNIDQMDQRKMQALQAAYNKMAQAMKTGANEDGQELSFETKQQLKTMMSDAQSMMATEKNAAEAKQAMWSAAGTIAGTVVGGATGGATGAKAGGSAGGAAGGYAGSQG